MQFVVSSFGLGKRYNSNNITANMAIHKTGTPYRTEAGHSTSSADVCSDDTSVSVSFTYIFTTGPVVLVTVLEFVYW